MGQFCLFLSDIVQFFRQLVYDWSPLALWWLSCTLLYFSSIAAVGLESLDDRRTRLLKTFAAKSDKVSLWLKKTNKKIKQEGYKLNIRKLKQELNNLKLPCQPKSGSFIKAGLYAGHFSTL